MVTAGTAEEIRFGPITVRFLVEAEATSGTATLFEFDVAPGSPPPPPHSHDRYEETLYGLGGTLTWTVEGVATAVGPGEVLTIPHGAVHRFENLDTEVATQLAVVTPGLLGPAYFRELAALVQRADGPPDVEAILDVMRRHGLTPAV
ncbi:MAG TPA: cupin domain-containing protein [Gaiellaceae bacterium]|nr:cupin domain-containing protein [Gaiellaceae bacterium]